MRLISPSYFYQRMVTNLVILFLLFVFFTIQKFQNDLLFLCRGSFQALPFLEPILIKTVIYNIVSIMILSHLFPLVSCFNHFINDCDM